MKERARIVTLQKCFFARRDNAVSITDSCIYSCSRHQVGPTLPLNRKPKDAHSSWAELTSDLHIIPLSRTRGVLPPCLLLSNTCYLILSWNSWIGNIEFESSACVLRTCSFWRLSPPLPPASDARAFNIFEPTVLCWLTPFAGGLCECGLPLFLPTLACC